MAPTADVTPTLAAVDGGDAGGAAPAAAIGRKGAGGAAPAPKGKGKGKSKAMKAKAMKTMKAMRAKRAMKAKGEKVGKTTESETPASGEKPEKTKGKRGVLLEKISGWSSGARLDAAMKRPAAADTVAVQTRRDRNANTAFQKFKRNSLLPEWVEEAAKEVTLGDLVLQ